MSITGLEVFDPTIQETNIWLGVIAEDLVPDRQVAYRLLRAVLHAIRDGPTVDQAAHLSAQLPMLIRGICYEISPGANPKHRPQLRRISQRGCRRSRRYPANQSGRCLRSRVQLRASAHHSGSASARVLVAAGTSPTSPRIH